MPKFCGLTLCTPLNAFTLLRPIPKAKADYAAGIAFMRLHNTFSFCQALLIRLTFVLGDILADAGKRIMASFSNFQERTLICTEPSFK